MTCDKPTVRHALLISALWLAACTDESTPAADPSSSSARQQAIDPGDTGSEEPQVADAGSLVGAVTVEELCSSQDYPASGGLTPPRAEPTCEGKACGAECNPCNGRADCTPPEGDYACNTWGGCFAVVRNPKASDSGEPVGPVQVPTSVEELCSPQDYPASGGLTPPMREFACQGKECGETCDPCLIEGGTRPNCLPVPDADYACNTWGGCFPVMR